MSCPGCGTHNDAGMNFCQSCGRSIAEATPVPGGPGAPPRSREPAEPAPPAGPAPPAAPAATDREKQICPNCGGQTPAGFSFCQQCGKPLPAPRGAVLAHAPTPIAEVSGELGGSRPAPAAAAVGPTLASGSEPAAAPPGRPKHPTPAPAPPPPARPASHPGAPSRSLETPVGGGVGSPAAAVAPRRSSAPAWGTLVAVRPDGSDGTRYELAGEWIDLGRGDADLSFQDRHLASRHARFENRDGGPWLAPIDRQNGVFLRLTGPVELEHGDRLLFGRELFRFELVEEQERRAEPLVRHGVALFGSPARPAWGRLVQLLQNGAALDVRHLIAEEVTLGREVGDIVCGDDEFLSRSHARFRRRESGCVLEDLGSSNGSFLRLRGPHRLSAGDCLRIGDQMFRFEPAVG